MNFKCKVFTSDGRLCTQTFSTASKIIEHFKTVHGLKESVNEFPCIANNHCSKQFLTFSG